MKLTINDHHFTTPDSWNDCDLRTALLIHHTLMQPVPRDLRGEALMHHRRIAVFLALTGIPAELFSSAPFSGATVAERSRSEEEDDNLLYEAILHEAVITVTAPFFEVATNEDTSEETTSIRYELTRNPYPALMYKERGKTMKLYGPADGVDNLTLYELGAAFTAWEVWTEKPTDENAATILATLYRPPKPVTPEGRISNYGGDRRLPLHDHETTVPARARHMAQLPLAVRGLLLFWFASCRMQIIRDNPVLFKSDKPSSGSASFGWGGLMLSLADGLVNLEPISKQSWANAFTYMAFLETRRQEAEREAQLRKMQRR